MTYRLEIEIKGLPKTPNARMHWAVKAAEVRKWRKAVCYQAISKRPEEPLTKAHVTFIRHSTTRPDFDNLAASFKGACDGLQDAGIIANDNYETIGDPTYSWVKAKQNQGKIQIIVTSIGENTEDGNG